MERKGQTEISSTREVSFKDSQVTVLSRAFGLKQHLSPSEVEKLARQTKLSQKQVRTWFANKRSRWKLGKSTAFSKIAKVAVLMDMNTINALKESILMHSNADNVVGDDSNESDESMSLSEKTSVLDRQRVSLKQTKFLMMEKENPNGETETPLIKQCTSTNKYLENLLQKIEELEDCLKEREGELYFTKKELAGCKEDLESKERVLKTIQQSIPRVVSDHKKNLELKDTEILELRNKFESSETRNIELRGELARLKKEIQDGGRKEVTLLRAQNEQYQETVRDLKQKLAENSPRNQLVCKSGNDSEEQKLRVKLKENQCLLLESSLGATRNQLVECKDQNAELQRREFQNVEKISVLQFELHSKSAELDTMGLVIRRLNDKIKFLNQRTEQNIEEQQLNLVKDLESPSKKRMRIEEEENYSEGMLVVQALLSDIISVFVLQSVL